MPEVLLANAGGKSCCLDDGYTSYLHNPETTPKQAHTKLFFFQFSKGKYGLFKVNGQIDQLDMIVNYTQLWPHACPWHLAIS